MNAIATNSGELVGLTVVDLSRYLPGPYCTRLLADMGATVIKVESPQGDPMRGIAWYRELNQDKRIVSLDLRDHAGRASLEELLSAADVCVEGFRPSTARALGSTAPPWSGGTRISSTVRSAAIQAAGKPPSGRATI